MLLNSSAYAHGEGLLCPRLEDTGNRPLRQTISAFVTYVYRVDCPRNNPVDSVYFENSPVRLHAVVAGPKDGPVVVLLHGFPEFWYGWRKQIEPLAAAGFRVIAPDQRGYNLSSKPHGVTSYALPELASDVIAIADQLGQQKIFLAGHDWGAAVAWRDRKSTRLNSSHVAISYAVFCLKKKNRELTFTSKDI